MADNLTIKQNLEKLGLNESEIEIYLALVSKDLMSVSKLSKITGIPRTTVYRICDSLSDKKFIEWIIDQSGKKVKAVPPEMLGFLVQEKQSELNTTKKAILDLKKAIELPSKNVPETQVRYYKGKSGMKQLIWNTLRAKKEIVGYSIYGRKEIIGSRFDQKYIWEFRKRNLRDRVLVNTEIVPKVRKAISGTHQQKIGDVRVMSNQDFYVSGDTYIYNNVYAVNFWNKDEIVGVEVENPEIAKVQKGIFKILWKKSQPL